MIVNFITPVTNVDFQCSSFSFRGLDYWTHQEGKHYSGPFFKTDFFKTTFGVGHSYLIRDGAIVCAVDIEKMGYKCDPNGIFPLLVEIHNSINFFIGSFWYVQDNAFSTIGTYAYAPDFVTYVSNLETRVTTCQGGHVKRILSSSSIGSVIKFVDLIQSIRRPLTPLANAPDDPSPYAGAIKGELAVNSHTHSRLFRAFIMISNARMQAMLPAKISFYIMALECLFTGDSEISFKVSLRTSVFVSQNPEERVSLFRKLKRAYRTRSEFLHGMKVQDTDFLSLQEKCKMLDDLLRRLCKELLFGPHLNVFNEMEDGEFQKWLDLYILFNGDDERIQSMLSSDNRNHNVRKEKFKKQRSTNR